jgi:predicted nuclease of predicted toxin-antitoxin system
LDRGFDACHVAELGLDRAADADLIVYARKQGRTIVTLDADFHRLLAVGGAATPSVIRIRKEGLRGPEIAVLVLQIIERVGNQLEQGAMVTITDRTIRLRRLPVRRDNN